MFNTFNSSNVSLAGRPGIRLTPIENTSFRGKWANGNNIWQPSSTDSDSIYHDQTNSGSNQTPNVWGAHLTGSLGASNRGFQDVANMSRTVVGGASKNGDHNTSASSGAGSHMLVPSAPLPDRHIGPLTSPTRLRGNGITSTDTGTTMTSLGQSSLLPGSAPDSEPSDFSASSFSNRKGWTIGKSFRPFNIEEAQEFVPHYLQSERRESNHRYQDISDEVTGFHNLAINGNAVRRHDRYTPPMHQRDRQHIVKAPQSLINTGPRVVVDVDQSLDFNLHNATPNKTRSQLSSFRAGPVQDVWSRQQLGDSFVHGVVTPATRNASRLRPDVASYQPFNHFYNADSSNERTQNGRYTWDDKNCYPATNDGPHNHAQTWHDRLDNAHTLSNDIPLANLAASSNSGGVRHQPGNHSYGLRTDLGSARTRTFGTDTQSRMFGSVTPPVSGAKFSTQSSSASQFSELRSTPGSNGQLEYSPEGQTLTQSYQQNYVAEQSSTTFSYYVDGRYPQGSESSNPPRSEILEEYRAYAKTRKFELKEIYGHIVEFSGDQAGSRFIQTKLEQANSDEKDQIFAELQTNARQLMSDVFGNYVIQKMFDHGSQTQKKALAGYMQGNILKLSMQAYGCRCVQKAIDHVLVDQQATLIKELDGHVMAVVESQHGNHVIQKAIELIPEQHIQFIVDAHKNQIVRLSKHTYGCRIIQRMLENCPATRRSILEELYTSIPMLIDDQFGNYVIQCVIARCDPADRRRVIGFVQQKLLAYSMHKFASNVVEKAIQHAEKPQREEMVRVLTTAHPQFGMQSPVMTLLRDQFGNYVMQTVLKTIEGPYQHVLAVEIRHHLAVIGKMSRGKQISAMTDTVNAILAGHSPASVSTDPQTPQTPTSLQSDSDSATPMTKVMDDIPPEYTFRDAQRNGLSLQSFRA